MRKTILVNENTASYVYNPVADTFMGCRFVNCSVTKYVEKSVN